MIEDPAVVAWRLALAPRPHARISAPGHHWWREWVTATWRSAYDAWCVERERVAIGYETEMAEFARDNPPPRLSQFMRAGRFSTDPYQLGGRP